MTIKGPYGFGRGWNAKASAWDCDPNGYVDAQNIEIQYGHVIKKNGNILWSGAHPGGTSQMGCLLYWGSNYYACVATKVAYTAGGSSSATWTDITNGNTFNGGDGMWMASLGGYLMIGTTQGYMAYTTGGNTTQFADDIPTHPPGHTLCGTVANNYLFCGNGSSNGVNYPHRVFWSNVETPLLFAATNFVDVDVSDGSHQVLAVFPFGQNLLIFKDNVIAFLYTQSTAGSLGPLIMIQEEYGIAGPNCVDKMPDGRVVFLASNNHVYIYDGNTFQDISDQPPPYSNIQPIFGALAFPGYSGIGQGCVKVYQGKNQVWVTYPFSWTNVVGNTYTNGVIFIYDIVQNMWLSAYPDHRVYVMLDLLTTTGELLISGGAVLFQEDTGGSNADTTGAQTFDAYVTKSIVIGGDSRDFTPRSAVLPYYAASFQAAVYTGANGWNLPPNAFSGNPWVSPGLPAAEHKKVVYFYTESTGWDTFQLRFDGFSVNQPFKLSPFYLSDQIEVQV
jgi:hypothetical protein